MESQSVNAEGPAAPYREEETRQVARIEKLGADANSFDFWQKNQNNGQVSSGRSRNALSTRERPLSGTAVAGMYFLHKSLPNSNWCRY